MNEVDKAKEYAKEKVTEALNQVVADAYMAGYNAGYQDGYNKVVKEISSSDEMEFVDLGLPSGTLWASDYVKDGDDVLFLPYPEAVKYNIPTEEQVDELREYCKISEQRDADDDPIIYTILGPNGNTITFRGSGYKRFDDLRNVHLPFFWQVNKSDNPKEILVPYFYSSGVLGADRLFPGYGLPIRLVQTK